MPKLTVEELRAYLVVEEARRIHGEYANGGEL